MQCGRRDARRHITKAGTGTRVVDVGDGQAVDNGLDTGIYLDGPMDIRLPTVDYMEHRLLQLGAGAYMYKTDLARGFRQLRVNQIGPSWASCTTKRST